MTNDAIKKNTYVIFRAEVFREKDPFYKEQRYWEEK